MPEDLMKTIHTFRIRRFLSAFVMGMGLACSFPSFAQQYSYLIDLNSREVTMLDNLDSGEMNPQAINDAGQVADYSFTHIGGIHLPVFFIVLSLPDLMGRAQGI
jgi:hypothetical protein